jgi:hypothetical protein
MPFIGAFFIILLPGKYISIAGRTLFSGRMTSRPETSRKRLMGRQSERRSVAAETSTAIWHNIAQLQ